MESTQTAVALDALIAAIRPALSAVEVVDGQPVALQEPRSLVIGWSPTRPAVEIRQIESDLYAERRSEVLDIACVVSVWRGDLAPALVRAEAVQVLDDLRGVLAADSSLGGAVTRAILGYAGTLDQAQTADGASATLDFTIDVTTL